MKNNMTKKKCLHKMVKLWGYLAIHPELDKREAYQDLELEPDPRFCPCCAYTEIAEGRYECHRCPLLGLWPMSGGNRPCPCTIPGSAYQEWTDSKDHDVREKSAELIENASIKALEELNR